jgi:CDGSH-type Zn-finger protein
MSRYDTASSDSSSNKPFCDGTHATIDFDGTLAN